MIWFLFTAVYILCLILPSTQASNLSPADFGRSNHTSHSRNHTSHSRIMVDPKKDERHFHSTFVKGLKPLEPSPTTPGESHRHVSVSQHHNNVHATAAAPDHDHDRHRKGTDARQPSSTNICFHCARQLYEGELNNAGRTAHLGAIIMGILFHIGLVAVENFWWEVLQAEI
jgi:hypothetical protein